jgi:hypothetical protein
MRKYLILILPVLLIYAACGKKPGTSIQTRENMLRKGKWKMSSGTLTMKLPSGADTVLNYMNWIPSCRQDDYLVFDSGFVGAIFSGGTKCNASDPDSISFVWQLTNNQNYINLYNGFDFFYGAFESINPYRFDTLQQSPTLVLDTLHGILDTALGYTRTVPVLDTIWTLRFDTLPLPATSIYNAMITSFSQSSFTITYSLTLPPYTEYPDSTGHHTGYLLDTNSPPDTLGDYNPIYRADTFKYKVTYTNF